MTFALLFLPFLTDAQNPKRAFIWYFGDQAGLDFSQGNPVPLTNSAMKAFEGPAVMCDKNGSLLFYTNGGDMPYNGGIWNKNHQLMPNGDLNGAGGCSSSFESSLIVPHPVHEHIYYLFTTDCIENNSTGGLRYSIIDMTQDGSLGDVVTKDVFLTGAVDESLTAIKHANNRDYWIVAHKLHTDSFYVYHFTQHGITGLVKTKIGPVTPDYAGTLRGSANGQKLVYSGLNSTSLFNFNNQTGQISKYVDLGIPSYSACFSPDCQLLYVANGVDKKLFQFDLMKYNVAASAVEVGTTSSTGFGGLQIGPDNKMYVARFVTSDYLGIITRPNIRGVDCNYIDNGIYLAGKSGKGGLPNYPNDIVGECVKFPVEYEGPFPNHHLEVSVSSEEFTVNWNIFNSNTPQMALLRQQGKKEWKGYNIESSSMTFTDLKPSTTYEMRTLEGQSSNYQFITDHFTENLAQVKSQDREITTSAYKTEFNIYPNPATHNITISVDVGKKKGALDILITETNGKLIKEFNYDNVQGLQDYKLPVDFLTNGIYQLSVQTDDFYQTQKLIILK